MRVVPSNRLLIQPTVQVAWMRQHSELIFQLPDDDQLRYQRAWQQFTAAHVASVAAFLRSDEAKLLYLFEDDLVFALLVGAEAIIQSLGDIDQFFYQPELIWRLR